MDAVDALPRPPIRPRLELMLPLEALDRDGFDARLKAACATAGSAVVGGVFRGVAELSIAEADRRYWSPALSVRASERDGRLWISARFGPQPQVWTMFVFLHAFLVFSAVMGSMVTVAQWMMHDPPWALVGLAVSLVCVAVVHGINLWGQSTGSDQLHVLHDWLFDALGVEAGSVLQDDAAPHG
ncbi:MAG: hypothetical protein ACI8PZ_005518 [Myxococcota bacterium]|jgi:hypothetical protein